MKYYKIQICDNRKFRIDDDEFPGGFMVYESYMELREHFEVIGISSGFYYGVKI